MEVLIRYFYHQMLTHLQIPYLIGFKVPSFFPQSYQILSCFETYRLYMGPLVPCLPFVLVLWLQESEGKRPEASSTLYPWSVLSSQLIHKICLQRNQNMFPPVFCTIQVWPENLLHIFYCTLNIENKWKRL